MGSIRTFAAVLAIVAVSSLNGAVCFCEPRVDTSHGSHACCGPSTGVSAADGCCDAPGRGPVAAVSVDPPLLPALAVPVAFLGGPFAAHPGGFVSPAAPAVGPRPPLILRI